MDSNLEKRQPRLNLDTLRVICNSLTDVSDVLSFGRTCSTLKNDALQRRLQMSPIVLTDADAVDQFYNFIFADASARAPHIYGLKLPNVSYTTGRVNFSLRGPRLSDPNSNPNTTDSPPQTTNDRLVAILKGAINLEYLFLSTNTLEDRVIATVAKISTLRELILCGRYHLGRFDGLLTALRAPLRHLHVKEYTIGDIGASFMHNSLSHFSQTLEVFEMSDFPLDMLPSSVTTQFPAMRSLKAELVSRFEDLGLLLRLFPNLRDTLEIKTMIPAGNDLSACRERSKEAQEAHNWPGLDHVVCSPGSAFIMALQCPIRRMDLDGKISRPEDKERLVEVLRHNSPRQLSFSLEVFGDLCDPAGLFPAEAADKLTRLVLCLSVQIECRQGCDADRNRTWIQFLDTLVDSMKHLRLTHLRIVLQYEVLRDQDPPPGGVDAGAVYFARNEDLRPAAMRFFGAMSTLQYALLTTCGYTTLLGPTQPRQHISKWLSSKAWHIPDIREDLWPLDTARGPYPEISDEEAEAVISREQLHLGSREQAMVAFCSGSLS